MIREKFTGWNDLVYGEIVVTLAKNNRVQIAVLALLHSILLAAVLYPVFSNEKNLALLFWVLCGFYWCWNLVLDEYGTNLWQGLRQAVFACETDGRSWFCCHIRLMVPLVFTVVAVAVWIVVSSL
jgi:hypothetical protein